jgi:hypothetical protein
LLSTQHPSKYLSPLAYLSYLQSKNRYLRFSEFLFGEFEALGNKKIWKFWKFSLLKCKLDPKKCWVLFEKSANFGNHKTEKENIGGK